MTTALDTKVSAKVVDVLASVGTDALFEGNSDQSYTHETGELTKSSPVSETVKAAPPYEYDSREADGKAILVDDLRTIIHGAFVPKVNYTCTIGGKKFKVVGFKPIYSGDDVAAYEVQLRL